MQQRSWIIRTVVAGLLGAVAPALAQVSGGKLPTRWDKDVSPTSPLPEYPRPQLVRLKWQSLNGPWDYAVTDPKATAAPTTYVGKILVPYPYESALSGVGKPSIVDKRLWYRRTFTIPPAWRGKRVLLHFGAVNWNSTVIVNDTNLGEHTGGYDAFDFDITDALKPGDNQLIVSVQNPLYHDVTCAQVLGKQRPDPSGIFYSGATGIWQSVWIEPVPTTYIAGLKITPDVDAGALHLKVHTNGDIDGKISVTLIDGKITRGTTEGVASAPMTIPIIKPHLWSPSDPHLYGLKISFSRAGSPMDRVESYAALRKISLGKDDQGRTVMLLNNQFVFEVGALDQGYWPDGIYTAPTDDALKYDIETAKSLGLNLLRKHAKVEPERWYAWADKIGILVWQDMPQAFGNDLTDATREQWLTELNRMIATHDNHPSIIVWTLFNEGWGQHDTEAIAQHAKQLDPTRLVNAASGGYNQIVDGKMSQFRLPAPAGVGDINDTHAYPDPATEKHDDSRALVCGEFGGISMRVAGHVWSTANFGYGRVMPDSWHLTQRYQKVLNEADGLRSRVGASAVVYTQLTDVEEETNGLMTYDRAVVKPIVGFVVAANQGQFPPLPPAPVSHEPSPTTRNEPQQRK